VEDRTLLASPVYSWSGSTPNSDWSTSLAWLTSPSSTSILHGYAETPMNELVSPARTIAGMPRSRSSPLHISAVIWSGAVVRYVQFNCLCSLQSRDPTAPVAG